MKRIMYCIFLAMLFAGQPLVLTKDDKLFTFNIGECEQQEEFLESDYYVETDSSYDAVCDHSPVLRTPFYKRMITRLFLFLHGNSLRIKQFAVRQYAVITYRIDLFFKTLFNPFKQLRSKTL